MTIEIPDSLVRDNPAIANLANTVQALTPPSPARECEFIETGPDDWDLSMAIKTWGPCTYSPFQLGGGVEKPVLVEVGTPKGAIKLVRVKLADGTHRLVKARYKGDAEGGEKPAEKCNQKITNENQASGSDRRLPSSQPSAASRDVDLFTICHAAFAVNGKLEANATVKAFYTEHWQKGAAHCHAQVAPLLAEEPFAVGLDSVGRLHHIRYLIAKHLAPSPAAVAAAEAVSHEVAERMRVDQFEDLQVAGKFEESFAYADDDLKRQFPDAKAYAAYRRAELQGSALCHDRQRHVYTAADFRGRSQRGLRSLGISTPPKAAVVAHNEDRFEAEWRTSTALQREFPAGPKSYSAYRRHMG